MKLELFVFEVFLHTERFAMLEDACVEFSLLENAPGTGADDPRDRVMIFSCRIVGSLKRLMQWCARALNELSPLVTYAGEGWRSSTEKHSPAIRPG